MKKVTEKQRAVNIHKNLSKGLQNVHITCGTIISVLRKRGVSAEEAEESVLEILKEHTDELMKGQYRKVIASMNRIFEI